NKSNRFRATPSELNLLLSIFERNAFPSRILRQKLAHHLRLSVRQIQLWFQNRRASLKS
ncbi:Homeodomain-like protein, partial [Chytriomyces cf. hyalinus JEL632]